MIAMMDVPIVIARMIGRIMGGFILIVLVVFLGSRLLAMLFMGVCRFSSSARIFSPLGVSLYFL